jgi:phenylalanine ammonia-lyase
MTLTSTRRRSSTIYVPNRFGDVAAPVKAHGVVHLVASNRIINKPTTLLAKFVESHQELEAYK